VSFLKHSSSLNMVLLLKHRSSFLNMSQSPPKDFSYTSLLLHSPSRRSQATVLALPTNASTIARPILSQRSRRDVREIQWSNDALSTLLDLYVEKYLTFGHGYFRVKDWKDIWKKLVTHSCRKCEDNNSMSWQMGQDDEEIFSRKDSRRCYRFYNYFMGLIQ